MNPRLLYSEKLDVLGCRNFKIFGRISGFSERFFANLMQVYEDIWSNDKDFPEVAPSRLDAWVFCTYTEANKTLVIWKLVSVDSTFVSFVLLVELTNPDIPKRSSSGFKRTREQGILCNGTKETCKLGEQGNMVKSL